MSLPTEEYMDECGLTEREKHIHRLLNGIVLPGELKLREIAEIFGVSKQRIEQIEQGAIRRIRMNRGMRDRLRRL